MAINKKPIPKITTGTADQEQTARHEAAQQPSVERETPESSPESQESVAEKEALLEPGVKELRQKIETMDLDDSAAQQAKVQAQDLTLLQDEEKVKQLLEIAKKKGVVYAVNVAKKMNNPYIMDMLHDILAKEGLYKQFLK